MSWAGLRIRESWVVVFRSAVRSLLFGPVVQDGGWASRSLQISLRRVLLAAVVGFQLAVTGVPLFTLGVTLSGALISFGCVCVLIYALLALWRELPVVPLILGMYVTGGAAYLASITMDTALAFASCWLLNVASCVAALLVFGRRGIALILVSNLVIAAAIRVVLPDWGWDIPIGTVLAPASILVAVRLGLPVLYAFAGRADEQTAAAELAIRDVGVLQSASRQVAEDARVLHDTAINTLGAIADGGIAIADPARVREQCARDVSHLDALRRSSGSRVADESIFGLFDFPGLPIHRSGLADEDVREASQRLDSRIVTALVGCAREAMTNAAKHSGADHVELRLLSDGLALTVIVRDEGQGFDGNFDPGRGLANSIFARAESAGITAALVTAPREGTEIILSAPFETAAGAGDADALLSDAHATADVNGTVTTLRERAGAFWGIGVTGVSVILGPSGVNDTSMLYPMIGIMALCWTATVVFRRIRSRDPVPRPILALLIICGPLVFILAGAVVHFGAVGGVHWQALAATGPFVLFLSTGPSRRLFLTAVALWAAVIAVLATVMLVADPNAAVIVLIAGIIGLGFSYVWNQFQDTIARIGGHAARAQQQEFAAHLSSEMRAAAQATYRRWLDAGLEDAIDLLRRIAVGELSPAAAATRRACDSEERYLRQLVLVSPELIRLGQVVIGALAAARERGITFRLRVGDRDAPDESTAEQISTLLGDAIRAVPPGGSLAVSVFSVHDGIQVTALGPHPSFISLQNSREAKSARTRYQRLGNDDLLESTFGLPAHSHS